MYVISMPFSASHQTLSQLFHVGHSLVSVALANINFSLNCVGFVDAVREQEFSLLLTNLASKSIFFISL